MVRIKPPREPSTRRISLCTKGIEPSVPGTGFHGNESLPAGSRSLAHRVMSESFQGDGRFLSETLRLHHDRIDGTGFVSAGESLCSTPQGPQLAPSWKHHEEPPRNQVPHQNRHPLAALRAGTWRLDGWALPTQLLRPDGTRRSSRVGKRSFCELFWSRLNGLVLHRHHTRDRGCLPSDLQRFRDCR